ncbi:hypothetical protein GCM10011494_26120 [Novosphingobium endophyticum]|uniref:Porin n=1 Tax=Novosphingobium endophyticum TaxID=1955250 RepID=A0A916TTU4_9SPHN|nr:porin [Novosphingobium endophyticum]GGC06257.1 hypothetical protein GCM10011494_26120 [Novosphingobium endophyticum]
MKKFRAASVVAVAVATGWALPAQAQVSDSAAVLQELRDMRAKMETMAQRIETLETELASANAKADAAAQVARNATTTAVAAQEAAGKAQPAKVAWKGAPQFSNDEGWSFKPRGRLQVDVAGIDAPNDLSGGVNDRLGTGVELRRAYIGFDGTIPGGFGYRVEADIAGSDVSLTDLYLTYKANRNVTLAVGHQKPFWGLEEMTSDLFTSTMERAAFSQAFGFERRVGASVQYSGKSLLVQGGVFADDASSLNTDTNKSWSVDGRVVFMPKLGGGILHLGASAHLRDLGGSVTSTRYRARPFLHTTDARLVDTGTIGATGERSFGLEAAYIAGPFHATLEGHSMTARRPGLADPTFRGGYAEVGYVLTGDDTGYKNGVYDRLKPSKGLDDGGIGAIQVNLRYDHLDLNDAGIVGGRQQMAGVAMVWAPVDNVRFVANYGHLWLRDAAVTAGGDDSYGVDAMGMRAQFDF